VDVVSFQLTNLIFQDLHKFHKRKVASRARGFIPLAPDNEIVISQSGEILSLQGHPELSGEISQDLVDADDGFYLQARVENPDVVLKDKFAPHDGAYVWGKVLEWAGE
jgi:GMP synthase-like glutamine amidotransferase